MITAVDDGRLHHSAPALALRPSPQGGARSRWNGEGWEVAVFAAKGLLLGVVACGLLSYAMLTVLGW